MLALVDWQQAISLVIVALAAGGFLFARWRRRKFTFARDTHCGCSSHVGEAPPAITFHARKGQRPRVTVRMK